MTKTRLMELIDSDESSRLEFKRDDVRPEILASEMAALLNVGGGHILLGVEDNQSVTGLTRSPKQAEEWVMNIARDRVQPSATPYWDALQWDNRKVIGIISLPSSAPDKPYKARRGSAWVTKMRIGTTTRDATREEEERLYQHSGRLRYGTKPVLGSTMEMFDYRRLRDYLIRVLRGNAPRDNELDRWKTLLCNLELATTSVGRISTTVDGLLLFGTNPRRFLPQSGIRAVCYASDEPDYATLADEVLQGPLVPLADQYGILFEPGLVDQAWDFVRRNTVPMAHLEGARRVQRWDYPEEVVREAICNAIVHRDYSIVGTDIMLAIYSDRLEVISPGRLPNTMTIERMRLGLRYSRNHTLSNVMSNYGYVESLGMGVRYRMIPGMKKHNDTEPDLVEKEDHFTVRLWK